MKKIIFAILLTGLVAVGSYGKDVSVSVAVQADNAEIGATVESYLSQEITSRTGISLRDDAEWNILVMVSESSTVDNTGKTYTISAVITSTARCANLNSRSKIISSDDCDRFENFGVFVGTVSSLKDMCEELIADFQEGSLEPSE